MSREALISWPVGPLWNRQVDWQTIFMGRFMINSSYMTSRRRLGKQNNDTEQHAPAWSIASFACIPRTLTIDHIFSTDHAPRAGPPRGSSQARRRSCCKHSRLMAVTPAQSRPPGNGASTWGSEVNWSYRVSWAAGHEPPGSVPRSHRVWFGGHRQRLLGGVWQRVLHCPLFVVQCWDQCWELTGSSIETVQRRLPG